MNLSNHLVAFSLDARRFALRLPAVERVVRVAEISPLPKAPEIVLGVINVQGRIIPVFDLRSRFNLPAREIRLSDQLIIARTHSRDVALIVDAVTDVLERPGEEVTGAADIAAGLDYVAGVVKLEDGLLFIHDLDTFLSPDESRNLDSALTSSARHE